MYELQQYVGGNLRDIKGFTTKSLNLTKDLAIQGEKPDNVVS